MSSPKDRPQAGSVREIYLHCATSVPYAGALSASIPDLERYAERALLLAERQDVVCTTHEVEPDYLDYLNQLGLGPEPGNVVVASRFGSWERCQPLWQRLLESPEALSHLCDLLRGQSSARVHPFIASSGQFQFAEALEQRAGVPVRVLGGDPDLVEYADQKHHMRDRAIGLGVPVARGEVAKLDAAGGVRGEFELLWRAIERQIGRTGRVIVRGTWGAAGSAAFVAGCDDIVPLARRLAGGSKNRIYLIESMVEATGSPSVQMHIDPVTGSIECTGVTDQRWEGDLTRGGNVYPSVARRTADMVRWAHTLSEWLRDSGYVGTLGLDFVEYIGPRGEPKALLAEVNPRLIGSTYPLRVLQRLNAFQRQASRTEAGAFLTGTVRTEARSFGRLRELLEGLLFSAESGTGIVPYVTGGLPYGECSLIALAGGSQEAAELYAEAQMAMEATCVAS